MDAEIKAKCEQQLLVIQDMRRAQAVADNDYFKVLVCLSYEYLKGDDVNMSLSLLNQCAPAYFKDVQPRQMREDPLYCGVVILLAEMVQKKGLVEYVQGGLTPTQAPGLA